MSVESARAFIKRVMSDKEFASQLAKVEGDEARQKFAQGAGYDFTPADVQSILPAGLTVDQLRHLGDSDELPDEMMEAIVGGKNDAENIAIGIGIDVGIEAAAAAI